MPHLKKNISMQDIDSFAQQLGKEFQPERVILFGSFAHGTPTQDSDVDILVIMPFHGRTAPHAAAIRCRLRPPFPLDLLIRTPEKIRERVQLGDPFIQDILEWGKVLYEAPHN